ncbi:hypothetical protein ACFWXK_10850 [Streptomyces sp. NPDC059070]|uniref:hypothetical protein n=1 Tax=Streptomyces sp. NPDC059070 TaxID=3346713 RepID=UPI0036A47416
MPDNSDVGLKESDWYELNLGIYPAAARAKDYTVEIFPDRQWREADAPIPSNGFSWTTLIESGSLPAQRVVMPMRLKVAADVAPVRLNFRAQFRTAHWQESTIGILDVVAPSNGEDPGNGEEPGSGGGDPGSGEDPGSGGEDPGSGGDLGNGGTPRAPRPGNDTVTEASVERTVATGSNISAVEGELAHTGSGPGNWALGIGGLAVLAGTGLIAGTGKRRCPKRST